LQIYRSLPRYRPDNLKGWIGKIAANKAIDWKRKASHSFTAEAEIPLIPAKEIQPDDFLIQKENHQRIWEICQSLPQCYAQTINSYYYQNKSYQQIADAEGISIKAVESRLYRARMLIRQKWKEGNA
jgi:RNA polymerase sigma factor (sigma-70 family)